MLTCNFLERFCRDSTSFSGPENRRNNLTYLKLLVCDLTSEQQSFVGWLKNNFVPLPNLNGKAPRAHRFMSCVGFLRWKLDNIEIVKFLKETRVEKSRQTYMRIYAQTCFVCGQWTIKQPLELAPVGRLNLQPCCTKRQSHPHVVGTQQTRLWGSQARTRTCQRHFSRTARIALKVSRGRFVQSETRIFPKSQNAVNACQHSWNLPVAGQRVIKTTQLFFVFNVGMGLIISPTPSF